MFSEAKHCEELRANPLKVLKETADDLEHRFGVFLDAVKDELEDIVDGSCLEGLIGGMENLSDDLSHLDYSGHIPDEDYKAFHPTDLFYSIIGEGVFARLSSDGHMHIWAEGVTGAEFTSIYADPDYDTWVYAYGGFSEEIKEVTVHEGVATVGDHAFAHCPNLTKVVLPCSIRSLGMGAFKDCRSLVQVDMPVTPTMFRSFEGCPCDGKAGDRGSDAPSD